MIRGFLFLGIIASIVISVVSYGKRTKRPDHVSMIVDTDCGYGVDDLFALTRLLIDPAKNPEAIFSTHFNFADRSNDSTMETSHLMISRILALHTLPELPNLEGSANPIANRDKVKPQASPASDYLLNRITKVPYGRKIDVVTLGAPTNLASAILIDSTIADKIRWYCLGLQFDSQDRIWNKNEFNTRNDLDAMDYLLNLNNLETHIMPVNVAGSVKIHIQEAKDMLDGRGLKWELMLERWEETAPDRLEVELSALMLIEAILNPDLVTEKKLKPPPENLYRDVFVYTWIDKKKVMRDFRDAASLSMGDVSR